MAERGLAQLSPTGAELDAKRNNRPERSEGKRPEISAIMIPIISVEHLSKSYVIRHSAQLPYTTLRESLTGAVRGIFHKKQADASAHKSKEDFWALKDVSFDVQRGERVGIIGRNGAGKTTLLKLLSRVTHPTQGKISIDGRVVSLLEVGTGFHPELTGRENIFLNGSILGMSRREIQKKFDEIVSFAEIDKFLDTPVKRYSSGMYIRLAFSVAAHLEAEILLIDEVLAVGDALFQKKCLGKMGDVTKDAGRTVLFVSHNLAALQTLCKTCLFLKSGTLANHGKSVDIIEQYMNDFSNDQSNVNTIGDVEIATMRFSKASIYSGESTTLFLRFTGRQKVRLDAVEVLIFAENGTRVSLIDLRRGRAYYISPDTPLSFEVNLKSVCLVEGKYYMGLHYVQDQNKGIALNLATLTVNADTDNLEVAPYSVESRGFVVLPVEIITTQTQ